LNVIDIIILNMDHQNLSIDRILALLSRHEETMKDQINKKYLEGVNELNNGFNQMIQTTLSQADMYASTIKDIFAEIRMQVTESSYSDRDRDEDPGFTPWNGKKEEDDLSGGGGEENGPGIGYKPMVPNNPWSTGGRWEPKKEGGNEQRVVNLDEQVSRAVNNSSFSTPGPPPPGFGSNNNHINENNNMFYGGNKGIESPPMENFDQSMGPGQYDHLDTTNLSPIKANGKQKLPPYHETKIDYEGNAELIIEDKKVLDNGLIVRSFTCKQCGHKVSYKRNLVVHIERQHKMKGK